MSVKYAAMIRVLWDNGHLQEPEFLLPEDGGGSFLPATICKEAAVSTFLQRRERKRDIHGWCEPSGRFYNPVHYMDEVFSP